ncbi:hypothetical protein JCM8547_002008 [Rhodosporidiobolus lusitaniae]
MATRARASNKDLLIFDAGHYVEQAFVAFVEKTCCAVTPSIDRNKLAWSYQTHHQLLAHAQQGHSFLPSPSSALDVSLSALPFPVRFLPNKHEWIVVPSDQVKGAKDSIAGPRFIRYATNYRQHSRWGADVDPTTAGERAREAAMDWRKGDERRDRFPKRGASPFSFTVRFHEGPLPSTPSNVYVEVTLSQTTEIQDDQHVPQLEQNHLAEPPTKVFFRVEITWGDEVLWLKVGFADLEAYTPRAR